MLPMNALPLSASPSPHPPLPPAAVTGTGTTTGAAILSNEANDMFCDHQPAPSHHPQPNHHYEGDHPQQQQQPNADVHEYWHGNNYPQHRQFTAASRPQPQYFETVGHQHREQRQQEEGERFTSISPTILSSDEASRKKLLSFSSLDNDDSRSPSNVKAISETTKQQQDQYSASAFSAAAASRKVDTYQQQNHHNTRWKGGNDVKKGRDKTTGAARSFLGFFRSFLSSSFTSFSSLFSAPLSSHRLSLSSVVAIMILIAVIVTTACSIIIGTLFGDTYSQQTAESTSTAIAKACAMQITSELSIAMEAADAIQFGVLNSEQLPLPSDDNYYFSTNPSSNTKPSTNPTTTTMDETTTASLTSASVSPPLSEWNNPHLWNEKWHRMALTFSRRAMSTSVTAASASTSSSSLISQLTFAFMDGNYAACQGFIGEEASNGLNISISGTDGGDGDNNVTSKSPRRKTIRCVSTRRNHNPYVSSVSGGGGGGQNQNQTTQQQNQTQHEQQQRKIVVSLYDREDGRLISRVNASTALVDLRNKGWFKEIIGYAKRMNIPLAPSSSASSSQSRAFGTATINGNANGNGDADGGDGNGNAAPSGATFPMAWVKAWTTIHFAPLKTRASLSLSFSLTNHSSSSSTIASSKNNINDNGAEKTVSPAAASPSFIGVGSFNVEFDAIGAFINTIRPTPGTRVVVLDQCMKVLGASSSASSADGGANSNSIVPTFTTRRVPIDYTLTRKDKIDRCVLSDYTSGDSAFGLPPLSSSSSVSSEAQSSGGVVNREMASGEGWNDDNTTEAAGPLMSSAPSSTTASPTQPHNSSENNSSSSFPFVYRELYCQISIEQLGMPFLTELHHTRPDMLYKTSSTPNNDASFSSTPNDRLNDEGRFRICGLNYEGKEEEEEEEEEEKGSNDDDSDAFGYAAYRTFPSSSSSLSPTSSSSTVFGATSRFILNGEPVWASVTRTPSPIGWTIVIFVPEVDLIGHLKNMRVVMMITTFAAAAVLMVTVIVILKILVRPLQVVAKDLVLSDYLLSPWSTAHRLPKGKKNKGDKNKRLGAATAKNLDGENKDGAQVEDGDDDDFDEDNNLDNLSSDALFEALRRHIDCRQHKGDKDENGNNNAPPSFFFSSSSSSPFPSSSSSSSSFISDIAMLQTAYQMMKAEVQILRGFIPDHIRSSLVEEKRSDIKRMVALMKAEGKAISGGRSHGGGEDDKEGRKQGKGKDDPSIEKCNRNRKSDEKQKTNMTTTLTSSSQPLTDDDAANKNSHLSKKFVKALDAEYAAAMMMVPKTAAENVAVAATIAPPTHQQHHRHHQCEISDTVNPSPRTRRRWNDDFVAGGGGGGGGLNPTTDGNLHLHHEANSKQHKQNDHDHEENDGEIRHNNDDDDDNDVGHQREDDGEYSSSLPLEKFPTASNAEEVFQSKDDNNNKPITDSREEEEETDREKEVEVEGDNTTALADPSEKVHCTTATAGAAATATTTDTKAVDHQNNNKNRIGNGYVGFGMSLFTTFGAEAPTDCLCQPQPHRSPVLSVNSSPPPTHHHAASSSVFSAASLPFASSALNTVGTMVVGVKTLTKTTAEICDKFEATKRVDADGNRLKKGREGKQQRQHFAVDVPDHRETENNKDDENKKPKRNFLSFFLHKQKEPRNSTSGNEGKDEENEMIATAASTDSISAGGSKEERVLMTSIVATQKALKQTNIVIVMINIVDFHKVAFAEFSSKPEHSGPSAQRHQQTGKEIKKKKRPTRPQLFQHEFQQIVHFIATTAKRYGGTLETFSGDKFCVSFDASSSPLSSSSSSLSSSTRLSSSLKEREEKKKRKQTLSEQQHTFAAVSAVKFALEISETFKKKKGEEEKMKKKRLDEKKQPINNPNEKTDKSENLLHHQSSSSPSSSAAAAAAAAPPLSALDSVVATNGVTIGIATGRALIGTLGTDEIKRYSIITNAFTEAAALERQCGQYPDCSVMIGGDMIPLVDGFVAYLLIDACALPGSKGKRRRIASVKRGGGGGGDEGEDGGERGEEGLGKESSAHRSPTSTAIDNSSMMKKISNPYAMTNRFFEAFLEGRTAECLQRMRLIDAEAGLCQQYWQAVAYVKAARERGRSQSQGNTTVDNTGCENMVMIGNDGIDSDEQLAAADPVFAAAIHFFNDFSAALANIRSTLGTVDEQPQSPNVDDNHHQRNENECRAIAVNSPTAARSLRPFPPYTAAQSEHVAVMLQFVWSLLSSSSSSFDGRAYRSPLGEAYARRRW